MTGCYCANSFIAVKLASVGRLLKQLGLTCQRPLFRAIGGVGQAAEGGARDGWEQRVSGHSRAEARLAGAEIFFGDEAGVRSGLSLPERRGASRANPSSAEHGQRSS